MRLSKEFYARDARVVAKELLGKVLVHKFNGKCIKGKIVETEAYIGAIDKASHAYGGKITERVKVLYSRPGIAYVYFIYGKYFCFNVITKCEGEAEGVLIRAVEPLEGINDMSIFRFGKDFSNLSAYQKKNLTSGPAKLCMAFNIKRENNKQDMCNSNLYIEEPANEQTFEIIETKRVGIDYAEEAIDFPWRYYISQNIWVSVK